MAKVDVYTWGAFHCSACAPAELSAEEVAAEVNSSLPCGTAKGWTISEADTFAGGQPMPCRCERDPTRRHWLLDA